MRKGEIVQWLKVQGSGLRLMDFGCGLGGSLEYGYMCKVRTIRNMVCWH